LIHTTSPTQLAIQYAIATPGVTTDELQALFAIRPCDAAYAYRRGVESRRTDWPIRPEGKGKRPLNNTPALAAARKWAIENKINDEKEIYSRFNITSMQCRMICKEATQAKHGENPQIEKRKKAKEYLAANRKIASCQIAKKFGVSVDYVRRQRYLILVADRQVDRRKRRRLFAVLPDGSLVDPKKCKSLPPSPRFVEVMV
jgi:hypothetical protein